MSRLNFSCAALRAAPDRSAAPFVSYFGILFIRTARLVSLSMRPGGQKEFPKARPQCCWMTRISVEFGIEVGSGRQFLIREVVQAIRQHRCTGAGYQSVARQGKER